MMKRLVLGSAVCAIALMVLAVSPAGAQAPCGYPPNCPALSVGTTTPTSGGTLGVQVLGFAANSAVDISIGGVFVGRITTDAAGAGSATVRVPSDIVGPTQVTATGTDPAGNVVTLTAAINVLPRVQPAAVPGGPLPSAGSDTWGLVRTGAMAIVVGALLVVVVLRRRDRAVA